MGSYPDMLKERFLAEARGMGRNKLEQAYADARVDAETDYLTGVYSKSHFERQLPAEIARAKRYGHALSLLMMDIDGLKVINDRSGHLVGDRLLRDIGYILRKKSRQSDIVCRYGGDEFAIILPETGVVGAKNEAEHIRDGICAYRLKEPPSGLVTASIGVAGYELGRYSDLTAEMLIREADKALYDAKHAGKNRVKLSGAV